MKQFLAVTAIADVMGKDNNGADLPLTLVSYMRYEQEEGGEPVEKGEGSVYMLGNNLGPMAVIKQFSITDLPEYQIHVKLSPELRAQYPEVPDAALEYNPESTVVGCASGPQGSEA